LGNEREAKARRGNMALVKGEWVDLLRADMLEQLDLHNHWIGVSPMYRWHFDPSAEFTPRVWTTPSISFVWSKRDIGQDRGVMLMLGPLYFTLTWTYY
jgi:hypothetical protein